MSKFNLILISLLIDITSIIIIPFKREISIIENDNPQSFFNFLINNNMISNINIGNPNQKIEISIKFDEPYFYIKNKNKNGDYNENISSKYKKINEITLINEIFKFKSAILSNETFYFSNEKNEEIKIENLQFLIPKNEEKKLDKGAIGLFYKDTSSIKNKNFITQLKDLNKINSYSFILQYENELNGKLYIGNYLNIFNEKYDGNNFKYCHPGRISMVYSWDIKFENITFGNKLIVSLKTCFFNATLNGILSNSILDNILKENFFNIYLSNNSCFEYFSNDNEYKFYICDDYINLDNFSSLSFKHKELNFSFIFNSEDLFIRKNGKLYFKIIFNVKTQIMWQLGQTFLQKYQFAFDEDRKIFGFYEKMIKKSETFYFLYIIIIILVIICIGLIYILYNNKLFKYRKIRVNELEDNFEYIIQS